MFNAIFTIIGTVIGAGFASGKEIFTFFSVYGKYGILGLILTFIIIFITIYKSFRIIIEYNVCSYSDFVKVFFCKSNFFSTVMCNIIDIFLFISFIVMISAFGSYFSQEFGIPSIFGSILIATLSFFVFLGNIDMVSRINFYIIPCLIIVIILLGSKNMDCFNVSTFYSSNAFLSWIISAILYAGYNLVVLLPILVSLKKYISNLHCVGFVSILSSLTLFILSLILFFLLNHYFYQIKNIDLPTVYIASNLSFFYKYSCGLSILGAIFTTAISSGYAFLDSFNKKNSKSLFRIALTLCFSSILFSNIGFSTLLNLLYPLLGIIGFLEVLLILIKH